MSRQPADERTALAAALASFLATLTLSPLVAGRAWLVVAMIAIIVVMVSGMIGRQLVRWWPAVVLAQAVVLLLTLLVLFVRQEVLSGPVPGVGAIRALLDVMRAGLDVTQQQGPPVDATQGVVLLLVGGAGIIALAVDLLAASLGHPALAGLPLLGLYCVPAALLSQGVPWVYFVLAAGGFLVLLSADAGDRIRGWGRVLTGPRVGGGNRASDDGIDGLARGGRRVGTSAIVLAAVLPALLPGLGNHVLTGNNGGNGGGNAPIRTLNPILSLRQDLISGDDAVLVHYRTSAVSPEPLRVVTDDVYDGNTFAPRQGQVPRKNKVQDGLSAPPGLQPGVATVSVRSEISVLSLDETYLPLPYPTRKVDVPGTWLYDPSTLNVVGEGVTTRGLSYTVDHLQVRPTPQQLEASVGAPNSLSDYLKLPATLPASIRTTARSVVAGSGTDYERAVRLQRWFRTDGGFQYSTRVPQAVKGDGSLDAIAAFLVNKQGYCVHFASAMAVMARVLGIPARVAVGFLPGDKQSDGSWAIRAKDAHAWPELYFSGIGWVRFEPTPRANDASAVPPDWTVPPPGLLAGDNPSTATVTPTAPTPTSSGLAPHQERPDATSSGASFGQRIADLPWRLIGVLAVLLAALAAPMTADRVRRRRRWRLAGTPVARAEAAWDDLRTRLENVGVRWASSWTPRALNHRLAADFGLGEAERLALARLVADVEAARYARPGTDPVRPTADLLADVNLVVQAVSAGAPGRVRRRARWFPPSGVATLQELVRRADAAGDLAGRRMSDASRRASGKAAEWRETVGAGSRHKD